MPACLSWTSSKNMWWGPCLLCTPSIVYPLYHIPPLPCTPYIFYPSSMYPLFHVPPYYVTPIFHVPPSSVYPLRHVPPPTVLPFIVYPLYRAPPIQCTLYIVPCTPSTMYPLHSVPFLSFTPCFMHPHYRIPPIKREAYLPWNSSPHLSPLSLARQSRAALRPPLRASKRWFPKPRSSSTLGGIFA